MEQEPTVQTIREETTEEFLTVFRWILSGFIEVFFIVCWVSTQWAVNTYVIAKFELAGLDQWVLVIAQWIFAIATLAPILLFTARLLVTMVIRTWRYIKRELSNE